MFNRKQFSSISLWTFFYQGSLQHPVEECCQEPLPLYFDSLHTSIRWFFIPNSLHVSSLAANKRNEQVFPFLLKVMDLPTFSLSLVFSFWNNNRCKFTNEKISEGGFGWVGIGPFSQAASERTRGNGLKLHKGGLG